VEPLKPLNLVLLVEEDSTDLEPPRSYFAADALPDPILPMPLACGFTTSLLWEAKTQPIPFRAWRLEQWPHLRRENLIPPLKP